MCLVPETKQNQIHAQPEPHVSTSARGVPVHVTEPPFIASLVSTSTSSYSASSSVTQPNESLFSSPLYVSPSNPHPKSHTIPPSLRDIFNKERNELLQKQYHRFTLYQQQQQQLLEHYQAHGMGLSDLMPNPQCSFCISASVSSALSGMYYRFGFHSFIFFFFCHSSLFSDKRHQQTNNHEPKKSSLSPPPVRRQALS